MSFQGPPSRRRSPQTSLQTIFFGMAHFTKGHSSNKNGSYRRLPEYLGPIIANILPAGALADHPQAARDKTVVFVIPLV